MSDSNKPKGAESKKSSAPKSDGKTGGGTGADVKSGAEAKPKESSGAKSDAGSKASDKSDAGSKASGKSARESVGGSGEVHYGYFSNVKTPAYRSGWDDIWNNKNKAKKTSAKTPARARKKPESITLTFDIDEFPANLKAGLAALARAELKKRRVNYDRREKAGSANWRIECRIER